MNHGGKKVIYILTIAFFLECANKIKNVCMRVGWIREQKKNKKMFCLLWHVYKWIDTSSKDYFRFYIRNFSVNWRIDWLLLFAECMTWFSCFYKSNTKITHIFCMPFLFCKLHFTIQYIKSLLCEFLSKKSTYHTLLHV